MNKRIKEIRTYFNLTQQEFANRIKVKRNTVATYEMGRSIPSDSAIALICKEFNVNESWLRTGEGAMFSSSDRTTTIANLVNQLLSDEKDSFKTRFITMLANLSVDEWEFLEKKALELFDAKEKNSTNLQSTPTSLYDSFPDTAEEFEKLYPPVDINEYRKKKKA